MPPNKCRTFQWNWANYPKGRKDKVSTWLEAFLKARIWIDKK
jgi:phosphoribosylformylglycinamidine synthase